MWRTLTIAIFVTGAVALRLAGDEVIAALLAGAAAGMAAPAAAVDAARKVRESIPPPMGR